MKLKKNSLSATDPNLENLDQIRQCVNTGYSAISDDCRMRQALADIEFLISLITKYRNDLEEKDEAITKRMMKEMGITKLPAMRIALLESILNMLKEAAVAKT